MKVSQNVEKADQQKKTYNDPMSFHMKSNGTSGFFLVYTKTWTGYLAYRKDHPGPMSRKSFNVWVGNGGRDREGSSGPNASKWRGRSGRKKWKGGENRAKATVEQYGTMATMAFLKRPCGN